MRATADPPRPPAGALGASPPPGALLRLHLGLLAAVELVYAAVVVVTRSGRYPQIPPVLYPQLPPTAVTLFLFLDPTGVGGGVFHAVALTLLGLRVLRLGAVASSARRLLLPSFIAVGALAVLTALSWVTSVGYGLRYQGPRYTALYAVLDAAAILALVGAALRVRRRAADGYPVARPLLWLHAGLYLALLLVLFPYLGEVP